VRHAESPFANSSASAEVVSPRAGGSAMRVLLLLASLIVLTGSSVATAAAETGVINRFGVPGSFGSPGVVVNHGGTGGAVPGEMITPGSSFSPAGDLLHSWTSTGGDIAINQTTGELYTAGERRASVYTPTGQLLRTFGWDVVQTGPDDSAANEKQLLTVIANGGTFTVGCCEENQTRYTSKPIPYNATAQEVEDAINEFAGVNAQGDGGQVLVTGGPGDSIGSTPYVITFGGTTAGDNVFTLYTNSVNLTGTTRSATVTTQVQGGGYEICQAGVGNVCKKFVQEPGTSVGGSLNSFLNVAVAPPTAANAGNLLIVDSSGSAQRVNEFTPAGTFVRAFGWDVVASGPGNSSADEVQTATVKATGGAFSLAFDGATTGAAGRGDVANGSMTLSNVITEDGSFAIGQTITGNGIPTGTTITGVGASTLTISAAATSTGVSRELTATDIPYNATPGQVQTALNGLATIGGVGGSVAVTGGPGDATGTAPYVITFQGNVGGSNVSTLSSNTSGLQGSQQATIATQTQGGAFETCIAAAGDVCKAGENGLKVGQFRGWTFGIAEDSTGAIYVSDSARSSGGQGSSAYRVQKFTPSGATFVPSLWGSNETQSVKVNASAGSFNLNLGPGVVSGTNGSADSTEGSKLLTNVFTRRGKFKLGAPVVFYQTPGFMVPVGTTITAMGPTTITMSNPASETRVGNDLYSTLSNTTEDIPYNATAGEVETAIEQLPAIIGANGRLANVTSGSKVVTKPAGTAGFLTFEFAPGNGVSGPGIPPGTTVAIREEDQLTLSNEATATHLNVVINPFSASVGQGGVTVTGGPGDAGGTSPYAVSFDTGPLKFSGVTQMVAAGGATPLSGGTGAGANQATVATTVDGGPNGSEINNQPIDVSIDNADHVYVAKQFPEGETTCAKDGSISPAETRVQRYDTAGNVEQTSGPCSGLATLGNFLEVQAMNVDPVSEELYVQQGSQLFILGDLGSAPTLSVDGPSNISAKGVTISGSITPNGPGAAAGRPNPSNTVYRVEFKKQSDAGWDIYAPDTSVGVGASAVPFNVGVSGLTPKTPYEFKVVTTKPSFPLAVGPIQTVTTDVAPPTVDAFRSSGITANSARLHALINPLGTETTYHFEYGKTPVYGQSTPETVVGAGLSAIEVEDVITGLEPVVYHFRVVATSSAGTTTTSDQTFNFYPEPCPNETVRQQTGSGSLPDCRAYELVSQEDADGTTLLVGGPNSPYATNPPRLAYHAVFGILPGEWSPPNVFSDMYVSTRTNTGWDNHYVGISSTESSGVGRPPGGIEGATKASDSSMDRFLDWNLGQGSEFLPFGCCGEWGSMAPYMWSPTGKFLGRLPTNLGDVPDGDLDLNKGGFTGDLLPSSDLDHYFFSSANVVFAPGGRDVENGSAYDNDVNTGEVQVISKLQNGEDIPQEPGDEANDYLHLPAASLDGSHVLMGATATGVCGNAKCIAVHPGLMCLANTAPAACPGNVPLHIYMRVNNAVTYDVSQGEVVTYEGMTDDGSRVYFTSAAKMTADDHDSGVDLFVWSESTDSLTRLSAGTGTIGDTDACNASWISGCGIDVVNTLNFPAEITGPETKGTTGYGVLEYAYFNAPRIDNAIAGDTGDVYFMSPEQFVGSEGIPGRRNLYVERNGDIQFIATLDPSFSVMRMNVSPDGAHAAFITASQLTSYDNDGYRQMYYYNADTKVLTCVSCKPSGQPPTHLVHGSQNGRFMSDDGRAFFATRESISPRDTDGLTDVYEYVDGRAQLISSGAAAGDENSNGIGGLVGVSADGVNVYFISFVKLVEEDLNGEFMRFYVARTNGGFPRSAQIAPCAAADECHSPDRPAAQVPTISSKAQLGDNGNHAQSPVKKKAKKKKKKRAKKQHRGNRAAKTRQGEGH
jgi:hypothetical protein